MKILYIGSFNNHLDEGLSSISSFFFNYFSIKYNVLAINTRDIIKPKTIDKIITFRPDIIHYLTGPTIRSFIILSALKKLLMNRPKTVISATRPYLNKLERKFIKFIKPDLIFAQSLKWEQIFLKSAIETIFVPNPINIKRFRKIKKSKQVLRKEYNLPLHEKLLLHVGHIKANRNIAFLSQLQKVIFKKGYRIVIVGSTFFRTDDYLYNNLLESGCIIITKYIKNIAEIYNACDYYIFPVLGLQRKFYPHNPKQIGVIDMPLSVLEALSCELPVISTVIDSVIALVEKISPSKLPIEWFDGSIESLVKSLERMENKNNYNFDLIRKQIDSKKVFRFVEKIYMEMITK